MMLVMARDRHAATRLGAGDDGDAAGEVERNNRRGEDGGEEVDTARERC